MDLLEPLKVPRKTVCRSNPITYDNGRAVSEFYAPGSKYFGKQVVPPNNQWSDGTPSFMAPISHYHLLQTEKFYVESGSGLWYLQGKTIRLNAGDEITIPRFINHRFENLPGSKEPLAILYRYDAQRYDMERRFFSNTLTYLDDCRMHGVEPSILQLCVFLADAWMPADIIPCPGGDYIRCLVNALFMWAMALVGRFVYGYRASYAEYYDPVFSKRSIHESIKKR